MIEQRKRVATPLNNGRLYTEGLLGQTLLFPLERGKSEGSKGHESEPRCSEDER